MKKGVVIGLVVILAILGYMATHKPPRTAPPSEVATTATAVETAAKDAAPAPAPTSAPVAEEKKAEVAPAVVPEKLDLEHAMAERALGDADAPVTVVEYASLTCPHCAHFATEILPQIKTKLIATGKLRLIFRDFPIDGLAMKAAKMARCAPKEKYFDLVEVLFKNRDRWINAPEPEQALMQFGALAGMSNSYMNSCIASTEMDMEITKGMNEAQTKYALKSTPSFVFDFGAEVMSGAQEAAKFEEIVDRLAAAKK
jgi:protein-disulfide isomerase